MERGVTERMIILGCALLLVLTAAVSMAGLHDKHYRDRRWKLLEARLSALEASWIGEH